MNKIAVLKNAVKLVVSVGASAIVKQIIENNVDTEKTIDKVAIPVASMAIGGAVGQFAGEYTDVMIDDAVKIVKGFRVRVKVVQD
jgi:Ni,Fe-hydrogenase III small subunit